MRFLLFKTKCKPGVPIKGTGKTKKVFDDNLYNRRLVGSSVF